MATVTSAAVSIPSFTGLKATAGSTTALKPTTVSAGGRISGAPKLTVKSSLKDIGVAAVAAAAAASIAIPGHAMAYEVLLGTTNGELIFVPKEFTVAKGEKIVFKNNGGFPHNVVFDDDGVPSGVDAGKISMDLSEYLNGPDETYSVTLTEPGTYTFYCAPHESAGMRGSVTVN